MNISEHLTKAIFVRNKVREGTETQDWVRAKARELVEEGFWNDSQIAEITLYARQSIGRIARDAVRPPERPGGGRLAAEVLDVLLELRGAVQAGMKPSPALVLKAIETGTSTKLIARITEIPIGVVLYVQRKAKAETEVESWLSNQSA